MSILDSIPEQEVAHSDLRDLPAPSGLVRVNGREVVFYKRTIDLPGLPPVKRDERGRLLPGQSLNPTGLLPSLRPLIAALTGGGEELIVSLVEEFRGTPRVIKNPFDNTEQVQVPTIADSRAARTQLLERGFGQVVKAIELSGPGGAPIAAPAQPAFDLSKLNATELKQMMTLRAKAEGETVEGELVPPQGSG